MKKFLIGILAMLVFGGSAFAFPLFKKDTKLVTVPLFTSKNNAVNSVWVGTFQLVWNDLAEDIIKGPVYLQGGNDDVANGLNEKIFNKDMISPKSYYKVHGVMTTELRDTIYRSLQEKFNETSDLLQGVTWDGRNYLLYAMLKKDFKYPYDFKVLTPDRFAGSKTKVKYFGMEQDSDEGLRSSVDVLFYNSKNDYAVILYTKTKDIVMLYRTNNKKLSFADAYKQMLDKSFAYQDKKSFEIADTLKIPFLKFKNDYEYETLRGKNVLGTNFTIGSAMQTVDFNMDNKGVKLKSEAAMIMKMSMMRPEKLEGRNFNFDNNFYLFMQEGLNQPYFALKVGDVNGIK